MANLKPNSCVHDQLVSISSHGASMTGLVDFDVLSFEFNFLVLALEFHIISNAMNL
jgi:hypothetical protein